MQGLGLFSSFANTRRAWSVLCVCLLLTAFTGLQIKRSIENDAVRYFAFICDQIMLKLSERLGAYALVLHGGVGLFAASDRVERKEWHAYVGALQASGAIASAQAIGYAEAMAPEERARHVERVRAEGFPAYGISPAGERDLYTSIVFIEPFRERNLRAFGFDMFSEPVRRAAMERARDTGEATLSGRVELVQESGAEVQAGTLMYVPVYRAGMPAGTPTERRAALAGWAYSAYRMGDFMNGILRDWGRHDGSTIELHIYNGREAVSAELLFDSVGAATAIAHSPLHQRRTLEFGGGEWLLEFDHVAAASAVGYSAAWATLLGGLALSGLLFGLMLALARARASASSFENASRYAQSLAEEMRGREAQLQKLSQAVEQSPESIVITDLEGRIEYVNAAFVAVSGYGRDEAIGENPRILNSGKTPGASYRAMWDALVAGRPWKGEFHNRRKDGGEYVESAIVTPIRQSDGRISHYVATKEDITEKKRIGAELDQHRHHLEELVARRTAELEIERDRTVRASRAKSDFLANMSHEIRTPINAVVGFAHLCLKLELPARGRDYVGKIGVAAQSLLGIVNDVLDLSKIDAGKLELESVVFSLDEVLEKVGGLFNLKAREQGVELVIAALPGIPERLLGDPLRLGQVLINLVGNALKFTQRGEVRVMVKPEAGGAEAASLRFEVRDTGIGMTPPQRESLFTAFSQADSSTTRRYGGSGLGLAISKQLVERMQGELIVESEAGVGSCFSFSARFGVAAGATEIVSMAERTTLSGVRVLVVDDNDDTRKLFSVNMKTFGCHVDAVETGEAALARLAAGTRFDLVVMDWHLPGLDGLSTVRRMRVAGDRTPVILITGGEAELARVEAEIGDIHAFLPKPVSRSTLYDSMLTALGNFAAPPAPVVERIETAELSGARILLVDDNDFNRQIGRELVESTGAMVTTADDGAQAVAAAADGTYDLVLMDLQMPVMDGYSAARILRERFPDLPILALTAHAMREEGARVLAAGMNDILTKPILPATLYAALARWLPGITRHGAHTTGVLPETAAAHPSAAAFASVAAPEVFDLASALTRVNGEPQMLERFLRLFRDRNAGIVADIGAALARQDAATARRLAHALKGGAGTVGLIEVEAAAARLETVLALSIGGADGPARHGADYAALAAAWTRAGETLAALLDFPATLLHDNRQG